MFRPDALSGTHDMKATATIALEHYDQTTEPDERYTVSIGAEELGHALWCALKAVHTAPLFILADAVTNAESMDADYEAPATEQALMRAAWDYMHWFDKHRAKSLAAEA